MFYEINHNFISLQTTIYLVATAFGLAGPPSLNPFLKKKKQKNKLKITDYILKISQIVNKNLKTSDKLG